MEEQHIYFESTPSKITNIEENLKSDITNFDNLESFYVNKCSLLFNRQYDRIYDEHLLNDTCEGGQHNKDNNYGYWLYVDEYYENNQIFEYQLIVNNNNEHITITIKYNKNSNIILKFIKTINEEFI